MSTVNHQLVELALQRVEGPAFERYCQAFFASIAGTQFVPIGGRHDGGADAFSEPGVYGDERPEHFWQATVQKTHRDKIRGTVARLREFGRSPKQLTYCTSIIVPNIDSEEDLLGDE